MATKTDIELKIVDSVDTSHTEAEVLTDSASNPDAFYVGRGYLAHNGEKVIEGIDPNGSYPNMTVGNAQKAKETESATHADTATDLSGRVEATPEVFTYRPSAGEKSIKDDNAFIRRVKGNSIVWNQLVRNALDQTGETGWWARQGAENVVLNGRSIKMNFVSGNSSQPQISQYAAFVQGHKYFVYANIKCDVSNIGGDSGLIIYVYAQNNFHGDSRQRILAEMAQTDQLMHTIFEPTADYPVVSVTTYNIVNDVGDSMTVSDFQLIDLTQMFGVGNEPTTVEEFRALYPDSYYPYNTGELRNLDCSGIKTVGFNQWDGKVEVGYIRDLTGEVRPDQNYLHTDFIRVIPNQEYYINTEQTNGRWGAWYDANKNYVAGIVGYDGVHTAPSNAAYIRLTIKTADSGNPDTFCINLSHTGVRDGEYEPYKEVTHALPLSNITNGEPLRKAGSVYDEINETHYIKRVGNVDLGSLSWFASTATPADNITNQFFYAQIDGLQLGYGTIMISAPYNEIDIHPDSIRSKDKTIYCSGNYVGGNSPTAVVIRDSSYNDTASFKSAMSGVMLNYELAEPIVTPIETPIDFNYYVEDFGTEEALLAEDSAPFSADIVYQFNATDQIRNNSRNIDKLQRSAFTPRGTSAQYIRGDGSYGDRVELSQSTPINDGEYEMPDEGFYDMQFILTPSYYAKSPRELDDTTTIAVFVTAPEDSYHLAEYWFEFAVGESLPNIEYYQPNNSDAIFRIDGDMMTYAVNILHLISSDGGETFFGELKNYVL